MKNCAYLQHSFHILDNKNEEVSQDTEDDGEGLREAGRFRLIQLHPKTSLHKISEKKLEYRFFSGYSMGNSKNYIFLSVATFKKYHEDNQWKWT